MESDFSYVDENLKRICENINEAFEKYRSKDERVRIMAVTKTVPPEVVNHAVGLGIDLLGENRVQEYLSKADSYVTLDSFKEPLEIHFIGHLQTNKVKYIIDKMTMIQSVDSVKLASEINRLSAAKGKITNILCEVNIGGEESKSGIAPQNLSGLIAEISEMPNIRIKGLMTIPPRGGSDVFLGRMQELFYSISQKNFSGADMEILSMGMSGDYAEAVKYGSTLVRIGTALFGERKYDRG